MLSRACADVLDRQACRPRVRARTGRMSSHYINGRYKNIAAVAETQSHTCVCVCTKSHGGGRRSIRYYMTILQDHKPPRRRYGRARTHAFNISRIERCSAHMCVDHVQHAGVFMLRATRERQQQPLYERGRPHRVNFRLW